MLFLFFFSSRRRHTRWPCDWSSDVCSSDLVACSPSAPVAYRHRPRRSPSFEEHPATVPSRDSGPAASLTHEQTYVDGVYARLDDLRDQTRSRLHQVRRQGPSGSPQNRSERDAFATLYEDRIAMLEAVEERLGFGRLDLTTGEPRSVGRLGLSDADHPPLLTGWRAPAARANRPAGARGLRPRCRSGPRSVV